MALLFMDGAEHYVTADVLEKYSYQSSATVSTTRARTGSASLTGSFVGIAVAPADATVIVGFGLYAVDSLAFVQVGYNGFGSTYEQMSVRIEADGSITARTGPATGTILGQTAAGIFKYGVWNYLEVKCLVDLSAGTVTVKLNGAEVLTLTGKDTVHQPAVAAWTTVQWNLVSGAWLDDVYVCDGSGAVNNDFLGECRVVTLLPQTDAVAAGSNADFTCSTSTDHGALVDDAAPNDDTDYVSSSTLNHVDSWEYPALGYTGTIKGVQMSLSARKTDSGTRAIAAVTRPVATNRVHATNHYLGTSYAYWRAIWELNPEDSGAWEVADVDGAEFGVKVTV